MWLQSKKLKHPQHSKTMAMMTKGTAVICFSCAFDMAKSAHKNVQYECNSKIVGRYLRRGFLPVARLHKNQEI